MSLDTISDSIHKAAASATSCWCRSLAWLLALTIPPRRAICPSSDEEATARVERELHRGLMVLTSEEGDAAKRTDAGLLRDSEGDDDDDDPDPRGSRLPSSISTRRRIFLSLSLSTPRQLLVGWLLGCLARYQKGNRTLVQLVRVGILTGARKKQREAEKH